MGRVDDVINVSGHRLSTGDIEEVLGKHNEVAECAVVAQHDELKGEVPVGFIVPKSSNSEQAEQHTRLALELKDLVRQEIGPLACYKSTYVLPRLPKTRSGKILRKTIKQILNQEEVAVPPTIEDASSLDEITAALS